jgi:ribonuclease HII
MARRSPAFLEARFESMLAYERQAWLSGATLVGGIDEAGRGPLAGPVVAACCILDPDRRILGLDDSKKLSPERREELYERIVADATDYCIRQVDAEEIDRTDILVATRKAMGLAVSGLARRPDVLLVDAVDLRGTGARVVPIIRGDSLSVSIAAASILAKVWRDRRMLEFEEAHPGYGFAQHKGYGTPAHYEAIRRLGLSPIHRRTFTRGLEEPR